MGHARIILQIVSEPLFPEKSNIIMSQTVANRLSLPSHPVWVTFGSSTDTAFIYPAQTKTPLVRISSHLASSLKMNPSVKTVNAYYDSPSRRLALGPCLGILLNKEVEGSEEQLFGVLNGYLQECSRAATNRGVFLTVFPPEGIDLKNRQTRGWVWDEKRWTECRAPLPEAIYNRITSRRIERKKPLQEKLSILKNNHQVILFNEQFLNKEQVHETLSQEEKMQSFLPETHLWHFSLLKPMLEKFTTVFLKPVNGSLGQGIIRITKNKNKWVCQHAQNTGTLTRVFSHYRGMLQNILRRIGRSRYIIQQGLDLISIDGRSVDFPVLVQKNALGIWTISSSVGRVANDSHIVSNLAKGGTMRKAADVLKDVKMSGPKPNVQELKSIALTIAETFEKAALGHYAELGIDLVLDRQGRLWLIELNSKPSKTDDTVANSNVTTRPSVVRLIDYVTFCTGWAPFMSFRKAKQAKAKRSGRERR